MEIISCNYLELRPKEEDRRTVEMYQVELGEDDNTPEDFEEYVQKLSEIHYEPSCVKQGGVCVIVESPLISMQLTEGFYQPFRISISNHQRMEDCSTQSDRDHKHKMFVDEFLLKHLQQLKI